MASSDMFDSEVLDALRIADARVLHKVIQTMVEFDISLPHLIRNVVAVGGTFWMQELMRMDEVFERALDTYIEKGRQYG